MLSYLTDFGRSLRPVIDAMTAWGQENRAQLERVLQPDAAQESTVATS